jgi:hypothetical protein
MEVVRVHTRDGAHIMPPCRDDWSPLEKLRWHAAVVMMDTGLKIGVIEFPSNFNIIVSGHSIARDFEGAWDYLSGISLGYELARNMT